MTDVLAIGPHPDDIELSAGGTVSGLSAAGRSVVLVDLTRGERATRGSEERRRTEAEEAATALGAAGRECLELPDGGVSSRDEAQLHAVVEAVRRHRPRLVITLHWLDDHPDHIEGGELVRRACYLAGLRNYPRPDQPPHRPQRLLFAMGRRTFAPSLVVDVTAGYGHKRAALAAYRSQFTRDADDPLVTPISEPEFLSTVEARDRHYGSLIGATFGEPFYQIGPVAVSDPGALAVEEPA